MRKWFAVLALCSLVVVGIVRADTLVDDTSVVSQPESTEPSEDFKSQVRLHGTEPSPDADSDIALLAEQIYNTAFLNDAQLQDYGAMTVEQIRAFLSAQGSFLRQSVVDTDGQTFDPSAVIAEAAAQYRINPKVILATLQKENTAVTRSARPSDGVLSTLTGCSWGTTARDQIRCAAERFRSYHDRLTNTGSSPSGWQMGVPKATVDGVSVTPATKAVAGQFTYTPYAGAQWGGNNPAWGGVYLFYHFWNQFGFGNNSSASLVWPSTGYLGYIYNRSGHMALDIWTKNSDCSNGGVAKGNPVYAAYAGHVEQLIYDNRDSTPTLQGVVLHHPDLGIYSRYFHMANESTRESYVESLTIGQSVSTTTRLGFQGNRRYTTDEDICVHLHYQLSTNSSYSGAIDPSPYYGIQLNYANAGHVGWMYYVQYNGGAPNPTPTFTPVPDGCSYVEDFSFNPGSPSNATEVSIHVKIRTNFPNFRAARLKVEGGDQIREFSSFESPPDTVWYTRNTPDGDRTIVLEIDDTQGSSWDNPTRCTRIYRLNPRPTLQPTSTLTSIPTRTPTWTVTRTPTWTVTRTPMGTITRTPTWTVTRTPTPTITGTLTPIPTRTLTPIPTRTDTTRPNSGLWRAEYFGDQTAWWDPNYGGSPAWTEEFSGYISKNWGAGAPPNVPADNWSARFTGTFSFAPGYYVFHANHDDGVKIYLDGQNIMEVGGAENNYACPARYLSGDHQLKVIFREDGGTAWLQVDWSTNESPCIQPTAAATISPTRTHTATPTLTRTGTHMPWPTGTPTLTPVTSSYCVPARAISCGESHAWANSGQGSTDRIDQYPCAVWSETGPEYAYSFVPNVSGPVTVRLGNMPCDLDLFVLDGASGICNGPSCIVAGDIELTFDAQAGHLYYLVVDGYNGAECTYTISVTCAESATVTPTLTGTRPRTATWTATPTLTGTRPRTPTWTATPTPTDTAAPMDAEPPTVNWISPVGNGERYDVGEQMIELAVTATDNVGIMGVRFRRWDAVNEQYILIADSYTPPYRAPLDCGALSYEWNQVEAVAYDTAYNYTQVYIWLYRLRETATPTLTPLPTFTATPTLPPGVIAPGHRIVGAIAQSWMQDGYALWMSSPDWVTVRAFGDGILKPRVELRDWTGTLLMYDGGGADSAWFTYPVPAAGWYTIVAGGDGQSVGGYRLRLDLGRAANIADINRDCVVDIADVRIWEECYLQWEYYDPGNMPAYCQDADLDLDGHVTLVDWGIWNNHRGTTCPAISAYVLSYPMSEVMDMFVPVRWRVFADMGFEHTDIHWGTAPGSHDWAQGPVGSLEGVYTGILRTVSPEGLYFVLHVQRATGEEYYSPEFACMVIPSSATATPSPTPTVYDPYPHPPTATPTRTPYRVQLPLILRVGPIPTPNPYPAPADR